MHTCLPDAIDAWKSAAARQRFGGELPLRGMRRLGALIVGREQNLQVELQFGVDGQGVHFVAGHLAADIEMICQRCMANMRVPLAVDFRLGLVLADSQAEALPQEYEPLVIPEGTLSVSELVEDELILALPLVPKHRDISECESRGFVMPAGSAYREPRAETGAKPFAALSSLLNDAKTRND